MAMYMETGTDPPSLHDEASDAAKQTVQHYRPYYLTLQEQQCSRTEFFESALYCNQMLYIYNSGLFPMCTGATNPKKATIMFIAMPKVEQVVK